MQTVSDDELWLLSFYRTSEISGALFFGRLARTLRPGPLQRDMTQHFADESAHAAYWTACIEACGARALKVSEAYQDSYLEAGGMPCNLMEVLAVTLAFERRVIGQYVRHAQVPDLAAPIRDTLARIMNDEKWHIRWVTEALHGMEAEYGKETVEAALARYVEADRQVYKSYLETHASVLEHVIARRAERRAP